MRVERLSIPDFGDVGNALTGGPPIGTATLSFSISWGGAAKRVTFSNGSLPTPFAGEYVQNQASMRWRATEGSVTLVGLAAVSDFAEIGDERNGVFFGEREENGEAETD